MGWLSRWRTASAAATFDAPPPGPRFDISATDVDPALFGLTAYEDPITPAARVTRAEAIQCPAVKRSRDLIASTIGALPLLQLDADYVPSPSPLLDQPEIPVPRSVTMTATVEDMLFEGVAWWRIVQRDYRGYPVKVRRLLPGTVQVTDDMRAYVRRDGSQQGQAWEYVEDRDLIRFHSPNDGLLVAGARAIRTALRLDAAASRYADTPTPTGYFEPREGADPVEDDDVETMLDLWQTARRTRSTAYVPAAVKYNPVQWSPVELGLADQRQHAVLEIARCVGVDPEDLGVSTTSRTYQNGQDRRRDLLDFTLGAYVSALQDRLSMADVTPRGYMVRADFNGFLRSDDKTRFETYRLGVDLGLYGPEEIQRREELPPFSPPAPPAPVRSLRAVPTQEEPMAASGDTGATFGDEDGGLALGFDAPDGDTFEVDVESRTIFGLAVPYGPEARAGGRRYTFTRGSLTWGDVGRVKLLVRHDRSQAVGRAVELSEDDAGLWAKFKVARGPEGDKALAMAADGVWDGLSVGLGDPDQCRFEARKAAQGGHMVNHCVKAPLVEISLTPTPAFDDARVSTVAAEADDPKGSTMTGTPGTDTATPPAEPVAPAFDTEALARAIAAQLVPAQAPAPAVEAPEVVPVGGPVFVQEEAPYRFDRGGNLVAGRFDFSTDLFAGLRDGDRAAYDRALTFVRTQFDVDTTDGAALNPSPTRADLYVDQRQYRYPLWEATRAGTLTDRTPFVIPKFNTASGLVAAHTEGTEPTPGAFTATSATVTPGAVSGKVEITRELWDQGGAPQVSTIIWRQMERAYYEALEAKVVAVLDAASPTAIALTAGGGTTGQTLSAELAAAFAALSYVRGGFDFDVMATQIDLYKAIVGALDDAGRPLFPILGPTNANGQTAPRMTGVNVHGVQAYPEWALAATGTVSASSYLFDSQSVRTWASAPQRLEFQYRVAYVDLAIWGYSVSAILDLAGVREITYDPAP